MYIISVIFFLTFLFHNISENECLKSKSRPQEIQYKKPTKFDNKIIGDIKKSLDLSLEKSELKKRKEGLDKMRNYNIKNTSFVKLWLSDFELRFGDSLVVPYDMETTVKPKIEIESEEEEINKIIEENKLVERLELLRKHEVVIPDSGDGAHIKSLDRSDRGSTGMGGENMISHRSVELTQERTLDYDSFDDFDDIGLISFGQETAALTVLSGGNLIHNINMVMDFEEVNSISGIDTPDEELNDKYKEMNIGGCIEQRQKIIQKVSMLKLEIANLSSLSNRLKNKGNKAREYGNVLDSIEKKNGSLQDYVSELKRIERRLKQLSLEESSETKASEESSKSLEESTISGKQEQTTTSTSTSTTTTTTTTTSPPEQEKRDETKSSEFLSTVFEGISPEQRKIIEKVAKMLIWLQENESKEPADAGTRKSRGRSATKYLVKLYMKDPVKFEKVVNGIKAGFEKSVFEKKLKSKM